MGKYFFVIVIEELISSLYRTLTSIPIDMFKNLPQLSVHNASEVFRLPMCHYHNWSTLVHTPIHELVFPNLPYECDYGYGTEKYQPRIDQFNGWSAIHFTSSNWAIPITFALCYLMMIAGLKKYMGPNNGGRTPVRATNIIIAWNLFLSLFSFAGVAYVVPYHLFDQDNGLFNAGFYKTVCDNGVHYGNGNVGLFVFLFIYSKIFELVDTFFLLIRKNPVILLHWYHHVTVLLYCWHAYSTRIGTGIWFAAMNYSVHSVMYLYFAMTQWGSATKKFARKFSKLITTLQILQMVVGIAVTVSAMIYITIGVPCYTSLANSVLGLMMYASYLVLFVQLYVSNYVSSKGKRE